jgi:hypothetical protein
VNIERATFNRLAAQLVPRLHDGSVIARTADLDVSS